MVKIYKKKLQSINNSINNDDYNYNKIIAIMKIILIK